MKTTDEKINIVFLSLEMLTNLNNNIQILQTKDEFKIKKINDILSNIELDILQSDNEVIKKLTSNSDIKESDLALIYKELLNDYKTRNSAIIKILFLELLLKNDVKSKIESELEYTNICRPDNYIQLVNDEYTKRNISIWN